VITGHWLGGPHDGQTLQLADGTTEVWTPLPRSVHDNETPEQPEGPPSLVHQVRTFSGKTYILWRETRQ
jgi:hypothetical protein